MVHKGYNGYNGYTRDTTGTQGIQRVHKGYNGYNGYTRDTTDITGTQGIQRVHKGYNGYNGYTRDTTFSTVRVARGIASRNIPSLQLVLLQKIALRKCSFYFLQRCATNCSVISRNFRKRNQSWHVIVRGELPSVIQDDSFVCKKKKQSHCRSQNNLCLVLFFSGEKMHRKVEKKSSRVMWSKFLFYRSKQEFQGSWQRLCLWCILYWRQLWRYIRGRVSNY